jgi:hypothetical protein
MRFIDLRNKVVKYQNKTFLYLSEGGKGSYGTDSVGRSQYRSYGEDAFSPKIASVKKEGSLYLTSGVHDSFIWEVEDFLTNVEIVDENPQVLLVNVPRSAFSMKPLGASMEVEDWVKCLGDLKPKNILAGNFPLDSDWIKKAITTA